METKLKVDLATAKTKISKKKDTKSGKTKSYSSTTVVVKGQAKDELFGFMRNFFRNGGNPDGLEFEITISATGKTSLKINEK